MFNYRFYSILVGTTDTGRYTDTFIAYTDIKKDLFEKKILLLYPSCSLCSTLTCLSLTNIVDISIEFDKKVSLIIFLLGYKIFV